jgi:hypothetical protein
MVDIRVSVADGSGADGLVLHLVRRFDWSSISIDETRREVVVSSDLDSVATVEAIVGVQSWLASDGSGSATLSIGERSFTMVGPAFAPSYSGGSR